MFKGRRIAVVGGGVIGLSVATRLAQNDAVVTVFSPQPLADITSSVAAAYWAPYWIGEYDRNIAIETLAELQRLSRENVEGVSEFPFEEWLTDEGSRELAAELETAYWWRTLPGIDFSQEPMTPPQPFQWNGKQVAFTGRVRFTSVVARMPDYLNWLESRLHRSANVTFQRKWVDSLMEITPEFDTVVNCTGWGAKALVTNDQDTANMRLLAGHIVIIDAPEIKTAVSLSRSPFRGTPMYVVPRHGSRNDVLCGGTAIEVKETIDPRQRVEYRLDAECDDVIARASRVLTPVQGRTELTRGVGIRPMRKSVRIERDPKLTNLFHCYGHGGSGLTLSWGSADRIVDLIQSTNATPNATQRTHAS